MLLFSLFHGSQLSTHFFRTELCSHKTKTRDEYRIRSLCRQSEVIAFHEAGRGQGKQNQKAILQFYHDCHSLSNALECHLGVHNIKHFILSNNIFIITNSWLNVTENIWDWLWSQVVKNEESILKDWANNCHVI